MKRDIPVHITPFAVLDTLLEIWAESVRRGKYGTGHRVSVPILRSEGATDFETEIDDIDGEDARAMSVMIESDLAKHHRWAIKRSCGITTVWSYPNLDYVQTLQDARKDLELRARRNSQTRCRF